MRQGVLDALPRHILHNQWHSGPTESGPIHLQAHDSTALLCELETRPRGNGNRYFHHTLDRTEAYANSPWSLVGRGGRVLAQAWQQKADLVLVAPVWKKQTWYPTVLEILPTVDYSQEGPNSTNTLTRNARCGPPTSCVEYLWRRYQVQQLSEKATELMLMS